PNFAGSGSGTPSNLRSMQSIIVLPLGSAGIPRVKRYRGVDLCSSRTHEMKPHKEPSHHPVPRHIVPLLYCQSHPRVVWTFSASVSPFLESMASYFTSAICFHAVPSHFSLHS